MMQLFPPGGSQRFGADEDQALEDAISSDPYGPELVSLLASRFHLHPGSLGADVGVNKGKLAEVFLEYGYPLLATAWDAPAQLLAERLKSRFPQLRVVSGTPHATPFGHQSVDFILSERALFWPDQEAVKREFRRILRPGAPVLLIADNRIYGGSRQPEEYEQLLRQHCAAFREKREPYDIAGAVARFFEGGDVYEDAFVGSQALTRAAFLEQTCALPAYPAAGDPARKALDDALRKFFSRWAVKGHLIVPVVCRIACGRLDGNAVPA